MLARNPKIIEWAPKTGPSQATHPAELRWYVSNSYTDRWSGKKTI